MQTSKSLSTAAEEQLLDQLYTVLAELNQPDKVQNFLFSFLSPTERIVFAKRLQIAWLLHQGKSYDVIAKQLNVSSATISSVGANKDAEGMLQAFKALELDRKVEGTLNTWAFWQRK